MKSEKRYPPTEYTNVFVWYPIGVKKLAEAAIQAVKTYALASVDPISSCCAISREIGAIITIVALFDKTSVKKEVTKYGILHGLVY